jgi:hypothetical protein
VSTVFLLFHASWFINVSNSIFKDSMPKSLYLLPGRWFLNISFLLPKKYLDVAVVVAVAVVVLVQAAEVVFFCYYYRCHRCCYYNYYFLLGY